MNTNETYFSAACAIDLGDSVVVTGGGAETHRKVTRYNGGGFVEDLPDLNTARQAHACAYFVNAENQMVNDEHNLWNCGLFVCTTGVPGGWRQVVQGRRWR